MGTYDSDIGGEPGFRRKKIQSGGEVHWKIMYKGLSTLWGAGVVYTWLAVINIAEGSPAAVSRDPDPRGGSVNQETLRQVTILMRHGERAPVDTYPKDPYINDSMAPYGWGQLTNKGRVNVYNTGAYLRHRYDHFLGESYSPNKFWLQSTSSDRTKMTAMILSSSLWKPSDKQTFKAEIPWQPVVLHYWTRVDDQLLIIWNACPKFTMERLRMDNHREVKEFNEENRGMYEEIEMFTGKSIKTAEDLADVYGTLHAEAQMANLLLPSWVKRYFPDKMLPSVIMSYRMNVFTEELRKLSGGPFVKKALRKMQERSNGTLTPADRKMFAYVAHDSTLVNVLSALGLWDGEPPGYSSMVIIELHEENGRWNVQIFQRNAPDYETQPLKMKNCDIACPLEKFAKIVERVLPGDYSEDCRVPDPNYVIPPPPPA
ncbi:venom acid phosphatase Acph-1 isoform X1 [Diachasma alloeum]|uniref:venom acid phosphatase Acph-1 isoform X1 n=2 Tax=Diachasma alloeum TaxID=454923 RepID=UPI00073844A2|nr:venom acid phosphatase Acph-1 isoform X1 [Diachasma alloeum]